MTYSVQSPPFVTGTPIVAADHNANWNGVATFINAIITGANMDANSIGTTQLAPTSVTAAKIASNTITNTEIASAAAIALSKLGVLTGYASAAGTVAATDTILQAIQKLNGNASTISPLTGMVTTTGLTNVATVVTNAALTGDVTTTGLTNISTIATSAVITAKINALAVTTAKIADLNVTTGKIALLAVDTGQIANAAVTGIKIDKNIRSFAAAYTVVDSDYILNHTATSDTVLTLPLAASYPGRSLQIRNCVGFYITSALNNIVPLTSSNTPRQAYGLNLILSATDGSWCELVSNGTYWLIVNASELT